MHRFWFIIFVFVVNVVAKRRYSYPNQTNEPCRIKAWVRAPDLLPGSIIQGDVRVREEGPDCNQVDGYTLGLRFVERAGLRTLRPRETPPMASGGTKTDTIKDWLFRSLFTQWEYSQESPRLWDWHAEERVGFETAYALKPFRRGTFTLPFALLTPNTNYPPVSISRDDVWDRGYSSNDVSFAKHFYQYFVDVSFKNGTSKRVPAGVTTFIPKIGEQEPPSSPETLNVTLSSRSCDRWAGCSSCRVAPISVTLQVTFPHGRNFRQGSSEVLTIVPIPSNLPSSAYLVDLGVAHVLEQYHTWAQRLSNNQTEARFMPTSFSAFEERQLGALVKVDNGCNDVIPLYWGTTNVCAGSLVTQTINIKRNAMIDFDTKYRTLRGALVFSVHVREKMEPTSTQEDEIDSVYEPWDPSDPFEEEMERTLYALEGNIEVNIVPEGDPPKILPTHYLSPYARSPTFIDPSEAEELRAKSIEERDKHAPLAQATVQEESGLLEGFWSTNSFESQSWFNERDGFYVGELWRRKLTRMKCPATV